MEILLHLDAWLHADIMCLRSSGVILLQLEFVHKFPAFIRGGD